MIKTYTAQKEYDGLIPTKHPLSKLLEESVEDHSFVSITYNDSEIAFRFYCNSNGELYLPFEGANVPVWRGEAVEVFISPFANESYYFEFDTAPNGAFYNTRIHFNGSVYVSVYKNAPIKHTYEVKDGYYELETRIPFSLILPEGTNPKEIDWKFNVYRVKFTDGEKELFSLSPTFVKNFHAPSRYPKLIF